MIYVKLHQFCPVLPYRVSNQLRVETWLRTLHEMAGCKGANAATPFWVLLYLCGNGIHENVLNIPQVTHDIADDS